MKYFLEYLLILIGSIFIMAKKDKTSLTVSDQIGIDTEFYFPSTFCFTIKTGYNRVLCEV